MKKVLRTKLVYECDKREEFEAGRGWYLHYDRSYDMYVSASTKEECEAVMESYEDAIRAEGIQDYFESNLEPEFDEKKKLWVGAVEVYVGNDYVADEKEAIKEVYNEWKRNLKATPVVVEAPEVEAEEKVEPSQKLIETVVGLSAGTIASVARDAGITEKDATVTYEMIDDIVSEWVSFIKNNNSTHEKWQDSWKEYAKYKNDMLKIFLKDEVIKKAVVDCYEAGGNKCHECKFCNCNRLNFELVLRESKKNTPATGYISQEERVQSKKDRLVVGKTYSVDDGAGTKMQIEKKENTVWWGTVGVWNLFDNLKIDYQEYILDLILK